MYDILYEYVTLNDEIQSLVNDSQISMFDATVIYDNLKSPSILSVTAAKRSSW